MAIRSIQVPVKLNLPKGLPAKPEDCPAFLEQLVLAINLQQGTISNVISGMENADVDANKPAAAVAGRLYLSTDLTPKRGNIDDGTTWWQWSLNLFVLGQLTVTGAATTGALAFSPNQPDTAYTVAITPVSSTGTPAAGSNRVLSVAKAVGTVTATVETAPGVGNSVTFDVIVSR